MLHHARKLRRYSLAVALILAVVASPIALASKSIKWEQSIEKGLAAAKKTGKPVMLDFYTEW